MYFFITETIHVILLVLFLVTDAIMLYIAKNEEGINNEYFLFHKKWGYLKIELLKLLVALAIIYELMHHTLKSGTLLVIVLAYCILVLKFLIDYIKHKRRTK